MLEEILQETRNSEKFPDELVKKEGQRPHPLGMKVMTTLRRRVAISYSHAVTFVNLPATIADSYPFVVLVADVLSAQSAV